MTDFSPSAARWYRQPVLWLGLLVFVLFIVASAFTIALASRHADEPLPVDGERVLKVPLAGAQSASNPVGLG